MAGLIWKHGFTVNCQRWHWTDNHQQKYQQSQQSAGSPWHSPTNSRSDWNRNLLLCVPAQRFIAAGCGQTAGQAAWLPTAGLQFEPGRAISSLHVPETTVKIEHVRICSHRHGCLLLCKLLRRLSPDPRGPFPTGIRTLTQGLVREKYAIFVPEMNVVTWIILHQHHFETLLGSSWIYFSCVQSMLQTSSRHYDMPTFKRLQ